MIFKAWWAEMTFRCCGVLPMPFVPLIWAKEKGRRARRDGMMKRILKGRYVQLESTGFEDLDMVTAS